LGDYCVIITRWCVVAEGLFQIYKKDAFIYNVAIV